MSLELASAGPRPGMVERSASAGPDSEAIDRRLQQFWDMLRSRAGTVQGDTGQPPKGQPINTWLFNRTFELKVLVSRVSMHLPADQRAKLFHQLDRLHDPDDWREDDAAIGPASFKTLLRLLLRYRNLGRPSLGISQFGQILVGWNDARGTLTVECLANDEIAWTVSHKLGERQESAAGRTWLHRFSDVIAPYDPSHWFVAT
jgi:hypothetical protein